MITDDDRAGFIMMMNTFGRALMNSSAAVTRAGVLTEAVTLPGDTPRELVHVVLSDGREFGHAFDGRAPWTNEEFRALISWAEHTIREEAATPRASVH